MINLITLILLAFLTGNLPWLGVLDFHQQKPVSTSHIVSTELTENAIMDIGALALKDNFSVFLGSKYGGNLNSNNRIGVDFYPSTLRLDQTNGSFDSFTDFSIQMHRLTSATTLSMPLSGSVSFGNAATQPVWIQITSSTPMGSISTNSFEEPGKVGHYKNFLPIEINPAQLCPGNLVQNGDFELGIPTIGDQDINLATFWSSIWPNVPFPPGCSTGDFYNITTAPPPFTPPSPASFGNVASFWVRFQTTQPQWREGIMNQLNAVADTSSCYELSFQLACPSFQFGTPSMSIYGVPVGANGTNCPGPILPINPNLFTPPAVLLGTHLIPTNCDENFTLVTIPIQASSLPPGGIDRIFFTRTDAVSGGAYIAMDEVCLTKVDCPCCGDFNQFNNLVSQGFDISVNGCEVTVSTPQFDSCHWFGTPPDWGDGTFVSQIIVPANQTWSHTYTANGTYDVCVTVYEGDYATLESCWSEEMCTQVTVDCDTLPPCDTVAIILNTGWDNQNLATITVGGVDMDAAPDLDWLIIANQLNSPPPGGIPANVSGLAHPLWASPFLSSQWISACPSGCAGQLPTTSPTLFTYEVCFNLPPGFSDAQLSLQLRADELINEVLLGNISIYTATTPPPFGGFSGPPLVLADGTQSHFNAGLNCLTVKYSDLTGGVTGLNVAGAVTYCPYTCCEDYNAFVQNVQNAISFISNIDSLCKAIINVNGLPECDSIISINWGDGNTDSGPFGDGMYMHTYAQSGAYSITLVIVEYNATGEICFDEALQFDIDCSSPSKCDSVSVFVDQLHTIPPNCCFKLFFDNQVDSCFTQILLQLDSATFTGLSVDTQNGWAVNQSGPDELMLTHNSGFIPVGFAQGPLTWCVIDGSNPDTLGISFQYANPLGLFSCDTSFIFSCPVVDSCCLDPALFDQNIQNAISVSTVDSLCKAIVTISDLPPCDSIFSIDWGDGNTDIGPFGNGMYMHSYAQSGTYTISVIAFEYDENGDICFENLFSFSVEVSCECHCGDWNLAFNSAGINNPVGCGDTLFFGCPATVGAFIAGSFSCLEDSCLAAPVEWQLTWPDSSTTGITTPDNIFIALPSPFSAGWYSLTLSTLCGNDTCVCNIVWFQEECPLDSCCRDFNIFDQNVQNAITVNTVDSLCKAIITVSGLPSCDSIAEIDWGDNNVDVGQFGNGLFMHTYAQGGTFIINISAVEYDSLGKVCFDINLSFTIDLNCTATATSEKEELPAPRLFPNPANGELFVLLPKPGEWTAELWSLDGKQVFQRYRPPNADNPWRLNLDGIPPGVYLVLLKNGGTNGSVWIERLVKM